LEKITNNASAPFYALVKRQLRPITQVKKPKLH